MTYLTTKEVADRLAVSTRTVRDWACRGHLREHRLGYRTMRYDVRDVETFIRRAKSKAMKPMPPAVRLHPNTRRREGGPSGQHGAAVARRADVRGDSPVAARGPQTSPQRGKAKNSRRPGEGEPASVSGEAKACGARCGPST